MKNDERGTTSPGVQLDLSSLPGYYGPVKVVSYDDQLLLVPDPGPRYYKTRKELGEPMMMGRFGLPPVSPEERAH